MKNGKVIYNQLVQMSFLCFVGELEDLIRLFYRAIICMTFEHYCIMGVRSVKRRRRRITLFIKSNRINIKSLN